MRTRAERRHDFERLAAAGIRRNKSKGRFFADGPAHVQRDRFRKKWCGCEMCSPSREMLGPTIQEMRFFAEPVELSHD